MKDAAQDAMAKIHLAYLALQNAQSDQVRAFAQQILNNYGKTQADLFNMANQQAVVLPNTLDATNLDTFDALSQLKGAEFDKAYVKAMLNEDRTALSRFKQEAKKGDGWASQTLPTLESNLKAAQKVAPAVDIHSTGTSEEKRTSAGKPTTRRRRSNRGKTSRPTLLATGLYDATSDAPATCALNGGATVRDSVAGATTSKRCFSRKNGFSIMTYEA